MCDLSIVIVNYNTCDLVLACLESVCQSISPTSAEVWLVDNASTDGSVSAVRQKFPSVIVIANTENLGFARANNLALRRAKGKVLVLLNPDTLVFPDTFSNLLAAFNHNKTAGLVAPQLLNPDNTIQPSLGNFASSWTELFFQFFLFKLFPSPYPLGNTIHSSQKRYYSYPHPVQWASGACLAVCSEVVAQVGLLDESIFMYGEDMEWCYRVQQAGFQNWFWPQARVTHLARQSSSRDYARWIENYTRGNLTFIRLHNPRTDQVVSGLVVCAGSLVRMVLWRLMIMARLKSSQEAHQRLDGYKQAFKLGLGTILKLPRSR